MEGLLLSSTRSRPSQMASCVSFERLMYSDSVDEWAIVIWRLLCQVMAASARVNK